MIIHEWFFFIVHEHTILGCSWTAKKPTPPLYQYRSSNYLFSMFMNSNLASFMNSNLASFMKGVVYRPDFYHSGDLIRATEARRILKKDYFLALHTADNIKANIQAQKKSWKSFILVVLTSFKRKKKLNSKNYDHTKIARSQLCLGWSSSYDIPPHSEARACSHWKSNSIY